jgi:hypothetical protein
MNDVYYRAQGFIVCVLGMCLFARSLKYVKVHVFICRGLCFANGN